MCYVCVCVLRVCVRACVNMSKPNKSCYSLFGSSINARTEINLSYDKFVTCLRCNLQKQIYLTLSETVREKERE